MNRKFQIHEDHLKYYQMLEKIRKEGICNMWGASPYLIAESGYTLGVEEANQILLEWIANYDKLNERFGWQKEEVA